MKYYVFSADDHTFLGVLNTKKMTVEKRPEQEEKHTRMLQYIIDQGIKLDEKLAIYPIGESNKKHRLKFSDLKMNT